MSPGVIPGLIKKLKRKLPFKKTRTTSLKKEHLPGQQKSSVGKKKNKLLSTATGDTTED